MSWTDTKSVEAIKYLRDRFQVKEFIETGTFKGINARRHSKNFEKITTCEIKQEYFNDATNNLQGYLNIKQVLGESPIFLKKIINEYKKEKRKDIIIFYLDAHFYNPELPLCKRFVVLDELNSLKNFKKGIIIIHDFDNGLGHIIYDGIPLGMNILKEPLLKVNKKFYFYTNTLESCKIVKPKVEEIERAGLIADKDTLENLEYVWASQIKAFRGILYCLTEKLNEDELIKLGLKIWE